MKRSVKRFLLASAMMIPMVSGVTTTAQAGGCCLVSAVPVIAPPAYYYAPVFVPAPVVVYSPPAIVYSAPAVAYPPLAPVCGPVVVPPPVVRYAPVATYGYRGLPGYYWSREKYKARPHRGKLEYEYKVYSPYRLGPVYEYEYKFDKGRIKIEEDYD